MVWKFFVTFALCIAACVAWADTETVDGITWRYTVDNGEVTIGISGFRAIDDGYKGELVIPSTLGGYPVRKINDWAFRNYSGEITAVVIPQGVLYIGECAFEGCEKMKSVTIPDGVVTIGEYAFNSCIGLRSVSIPDTVTFMGEYAFYNCRWLSEVRLSNGLKTISPYTFKNCTLESVVIPHGVTEIGAHAFESNDVISSIDLGDTVTTIGESAFAYSAYYYIPKVVIPSSVTYIGDNAFTQVGQYVTDGIVFEFLGHEPNMGGNFGTGMSSKTKVIVERDKLWSCVIPGTWKGLAIDYRPDPNPPKSDGGPYVETIRGVEWTFYVQDGKSTIGSGSAGIPALPSDTSADIVIPLTLGQHPVVALGNSALYGCCALASVTVPTNISTVGLNALNTGTNKMSFRFEGLPPDGFDSSGISTESCVRYNYIYVDAWSGIAASYGLKDALTYPREDGGPFRQTVDGVEWCYLVSGGEAEVCPRDTSPTASIPQDTVGALAVPSYLGGAPVTRIGDGALYNCSGVTSLEIPESVRSIGAGMCEFCSGLVAVDIPVSVTNLGDSAFSYCSKLTAAIIPEGLARIPEYAFYECQGLKSVYIPMSVMEIGQCAFHECPSIADVTIPTSYEFQHVIPDNDNVTNAVLTFAGGTSVIAYSFYGCDRLVSVVIPEGVKVIGEWAFYNCKALKSVALPTTLTHIGYQAFAGCVALESVDIKDGVTSIGESAFESCTSLNAIELPEGVTTIGQKAFCRCSNLEKITVPASVTNIGQNAFAQCAADALFRFEGAPPDGLYSANIPAACRIRYNPDYEMEWKEAIGTCGFTNAKSFLEADGPYTEEFGGVKWNYSLQNNEAKLLPLSAPERIAGDVVLPATLGHAPVRVVGREALRGASKLTSVIIPNTVGEIGDGAFERCTRLSAVTMPDGLAVIGDSAFERCASLSTITIPSSVTNIGYFAFRDCLRLGEMIFLGPVPHKELAVCMGTPLFTVVSTRLGSITVPIETAIVVDGDLTVPNKWLDEVAARHDTPAGYGSYEDAFVAKFGGDLKAALTNYTGKIDWHGNRMQVWQDYVAGTDPLNDEDKFTATITMKNGIPVVRWTPELPADQAVARRYTVYGATAIGGDWVDVTVLTDVERHDMGYQFFKVIVKMR